MSSGGRFSRFFIEEVLRPVGKFSKLSLHVR